MVAYQIITKSLSHFEISSNSIPDATFIAFLDFDKYYTRLQSLIFFMEYLSNYLLGHVHIAQRTQTTPKYDNIIFFSFFLAALQEF